MLEEDVAGQNAHEEQTQDGNDLDQKDEDEFVDESSGDGTD